MVLPRFFAPCVQSRFELGPKTPGSNRETRPLSRRPGIWAPARPSAPRCGVHMRKKFPRDTFVLNSVIVVLALMGVNTNIQMTLKQTSQHDKLECANARHKNP